MTRNEYMAHNPADTPATRSAKHHAYYMQFANVMQNSIANFIGIMGWSIEQLAAWYAADPALNNLKSYAWLNSMDSWARMHAPAIAQVNHRLNGTRTWCLADGACIIKAYIRDQISVSQKTKE